ncbi:hypothetical protein A0J61_08042 [Choanephora cucurbitarum]|uniref:Uncharacterized protein n=1 Tax=Choanephora cucurbitarum TaxID=101091 RepID=A0A1C7N4F1_9FUNG|nr:hypothetical protein A0J61_08042 [Choanephora cucurbitarum]
MNYYEHDGLNQEEDDSDYSLDYEYLGPRKPNYRNNQDSDSIASELSDASDEDGFDMWDEDPYSTNDFTWESNDMRLTGFIKRRQKELTKWRNTAPWSQSSFWRKEKGWPQQLPASNSTTNHDQSANALTLVLSDYGTHERLLAVYRDRIIECGQPLNETVTSIKNTITWLDSQQSQPTSDLTQSCHKFVETHASISIPKPVRSLKTIESPTTSNSSISSVNNSHVASKLVPYTKYVQRSQYPAPQNVYLALEFEPLCLAKKYGYMAIGGIEGEFELYCSMHEKPVKIWGTKFKGKNNVLLMTNAVQIVRWNKKEDQHTYYLIACMNDAGVLIYELPNHQHCQQHHSPAIQLQCHIRAFDHVPINDARISPDGSHIICIGDDACVFHIAVSLDQHHRLVFGTPTRLNISKEVLSHSYKPSPINDLPPSTYSSQYVAWSASSLYFAHTSDTHSHVFIWRTQPQIEMVYRIDAAGYTYAIQFHPELEGVLVFSNRYGYLHTVNLEECMTQEGLPVKLMDYNLEFSKRNEGNWLRYTEQSEHCCTPVCLKGTDTVCHTNHLVVRHEITMISFRGEKNKQLRILAKINGLQWSRDGSFLYVSTKKRVLAYKFVSGHIQSLKKIAAQAALAILEKGSVTGKRKRDQLSVQQTWSKKWNDLPPHLQSNILDNTHFASHW